MPGKSKKKRKDLQKGLNQSNQFANQASATQQPFAAAGAPAIGQLSALSGIGTQEQKDAAENAFRDSLFFTGGETAFGLDKDEIDAGLSNSGLLFSQSRQNAVEDARQRNFQNSFNAFLNNTGNVAGFGANAAANQANIFTGQGDRALEVAGAKAGTRKGFLQKLRDATSAAGQIGGLASGAGNFFRSFG